MADVEQTNNKVSVRGEIILQVLSTHRTTENYMRSMELEDVGVFPFLSKRLAIIEPSLDSVALIRNAESNIYSLCVSRW